MMIWYIFESGIDLKRGTLDCSLSFSFRSLIDFHLFPYNSLPTEYVISFITHTWSRSFTSLIFRIVPSAGLVISPLCEHTSQFICFSLIFLVKNWENVGYYRSGFSKSSIFTSYLLQYQVKIVWRRNYGIVIWLIVCIDWVIGTFIVSFVRSYLHPYHSSIKLPLRGRPSSQKYIMWIYELAVFLTRASNTRISCFYSSST